MKVLVDAPVWSLALRRDPSHLSEEEAKTTAELRALILDESALLLGVVRQEILSGMRTEAQYLRLKGLLADFPDEVPITSDYEQAAWTSYQCQLKGIAGSSVDFLICAVAIRNGWPIFTHDRDFHRYARVVPIRLFDPRRPYGR